jgi:hypothetical protein
VNFDLLNALKFETDGPKKLCHLAVVESGWIIFCEEFPDVSPCDLGSREAMYALLILNFVFHAPMPLKHERGRSMESAGRHSLQQRSKQSSYPAQLSFQPPRTTPPARLNLKIHADERARRRPIICMTGTPQLNGVVPRKRSITLKTGTHDANHRRSVEHEPEGAPRFIDEEPPPFDSCGLVIGQDCSNSGRINVAGVPDARARKEIV